ncbi:MAG TPA: TatD family hydrolase [Candidatus Ozemobacteraceae bacterium]|nr:TatD family hydrolase [Candidatus Ozemobacteraceae bacterium]
MHWFDTHCHLDVEPLSEALPEVLARAHAAGVQQILVPAIHGPTRLAEPIDGVRTAWGVHPGVAHQYQIEDLERLWHESAAPTSVAAIGEIGLDTMAESTPEQQEPQFIWQLQRAERHGLPVLVHLRGKWDHALRLLRQHAPDVPWIMHNFCGSWEIAHLYLRAGAFLSFSGSLCRPGARKTPEVARRIPSERILVETDAPDLPPPAWTKTTNEPAALPLIARFLAELRGEPIEALKETIWENSRRFFPL